MTMSPTASANGITIAYETIGDNGAPPLLLVMGLGMQLVAWDDELCRLLADRGFLVIRFDNRDVGLSTKFAGAGSVSVQDIVMRNLRSAPYTLQDMAADSAGLLDALGHSSAHLVGVSLGGMIAQTLAIQRPARVRSLTSVMSTTGNPNVGQPTPAAALALVTLPRGDDLDAAMEHGLDAFRVIGSPGLFDEPYMRGRIEVSYRRDHDPTASIRQLAAILVSGDRTDALRNLCVPTLVIHGDADSLISVTGGEATAAAIPGARLLVVPGMGHDLNRAFWPVLVDAIAAHATEAEQRSTTS
jgi:pimeloyl-ACP methyl ester carboxylesterase